MNNQAFLIIIIIIILFIIHRTTQSTEPFTKKSNNKTYQNFVKLINKNPNMQKCTLYNFLLQLHKTKQLTGFINYLKKSKVKEDVQMYNRIIKDADSIINPSIPSQNSIDCTSLIIKDKSVINKYINELNKNSQNIQFIDSMLDNLNEQDQLQELVDFITDSKKQGKPTVSDTLHVYVNDYYIYTSIVKSLKNENIDSVLDKIINNLSTGILSKLTDYLLDSYNDGNIVSKEIYDKLKIKYNSLQIKPFKFDFI